MTGESVNIEVIVVALISLAGVLAGAGVTMFIAWRKAPGEKRMATVDTEVKKAEAADKISTAWDRYADNQNDRIARLETTVEKLYRENQTQVADLDRLRGDLLQHLELIRKLEHENASIKRELEVERERRRTEVSRLEACINEMEAQNAQLKQENSELRDFYAHQGGRLEDVP